MPLRRAWAELRYSLQSDGAQGERPSSAFSIGHTTCTPVIIGTTTSKPPKQAAPAARRLAEKAPAVWRWALGGMTRSRCCQICRVWHHPLTETIPSRIETIRFASPLPGSHFAIRGRGLPARSSNPLQEAHSDSFEKQGAFSQPKREALLGPTLLPCRGLRRISKVPKRPQ